MDAVDGITRPTPASSIRSAGQRDLDPVSRYTRRIGLDGARRIVLAGAGAKVECEAVERADEQPVLHVALVEWAARMGTQRIDRKGAVRRAYDAECDASEAHADGRVQREIGRATGVVPGGFCGKLVDGSGQIIRP